MKQNVNNRMVTPLLNMKKIAGLHKIILMSIICIFRENTMALRQVGHRNAGHAMVREIVNALGQGILERLEPCQLIEMEIKYS